MKKLLLIVCVLGIILTALLTGCGSKSAEVEEEAATIYKDGTYEGRSAPAIDEHKGSYGIVKITIENDKITSVDYKGYTKEGVLKDDTYGKVVDPETGKIDEEKYKTAQTAVAANEKYEQQLLEKQNIDEVDLVTGASTNIKLFKSAVKDALSKAMN